MTTTTVTLWGELDAAVAAYTVGDDRVWDRRLLSWDILGSLAHVEGLEACGLLSRSDGARLRRALAEALDDARRGTLTVTEADEDVHTALEGRLVARLGELGERVHTGRSRNDQVMVDLRLVVKDRLLAVMDRTVDLATALARFGRRHERVLMPGYTHQRRAMPSSIGLWGAGLAESLVEDLGLVEAALDLADRSPLGSAAGYGVPLPIDRALVSERLGFASVQRAVTVVQASRGKLEAAVLAALWAVAHDLGRLAWDVILWSSEEFGFLQLPSGLATGSSIMPQKKNPDLFELTRARAGALLGLTVECAAVAGPLPSGYHRDLQLAKGPLFRGLDLAEEAVTAMARAIPRIGVDRRACAAAVTGDLLATDEVFRRVRGGASFRAAYHQVADEVRAGVAVPELPADEVRSARTHLGGVGAPGFAALARDLRSWRRRIGRRRRAFDAALAGLVGRAREGGR